MIERVVVTPEAAEVIRRLKAQHGLLIFHQSGGCCEGTAPMCFRERDFHVGARDVLLGVIEGCPFYVGAAEYKYWEYFQLTIDITSGGGDSFSLEAADGVRFLSRSRMFAAAEAQELDAAGPPPRGPEAFRPLAAGAE